MENSTVHVPLRSHEHHQTALKVSEGSKRNLEDKCDEVVAYFKTEKGALF